ncbi:cation:proton antiporter subunit C [Halorarius halobius]|uniref:cation:proton antiporter subunit C n=1 Tax=Halorarius halobius TaxID=2962671 RepID=UPI0020CC5E25|nr:cation:proton antiporter subunit C [Halorarius halobius]
MLGRAAYAVAVFLVGVGLYVLAADRNLLKKVLGLNVFQTGIFLFLVAAGYREGGAPPLLDGPGPYVNPVVHVLVLTAIVVGVSLSGVALALVVRLYRTYGTLDEAELREVVE